MNALYRFAARSEADTDRLARHIAEAAHMGTVITLDGDLGAGKTRFSQAFAAAFGVEGIVNSPTFTIIKEYRGRELPLYHMDVYRINLDEAEGLGLDDYFYGDGVTLLEWSNRIVELLPEDRLEIRIIRKEDDQRFFEIVPHGNKSQEICTALLGNGVIS